MPDLRSILCLGLPLAALVCAHPTPESDDVESSISAKWDDLLRTLPGESLRAAIDSNLRPKYREGIFEDEHDAIAAVKSDDPNLASMLVDVAKQDAIVKNYLRKRQDTNATVSTTVTSLATDGATSLTTETTTTQEPPATQGQSSSSFLSNESPTASSPVPASTVVEGDTATVTSSVVTITASSSSSGIEGQTTPTTSDTAPSASSLSLSVPSSFQSSSSLIITAPSSTEPAAQPTSEPPVSAPSTTQTGVIIPVETTGGDGSVGTTSAFETAAPTSIAVPVTTINDEGQAVTTSTLAGAAIVSSTNAQGSVMVTTSPLSNVAVGPGGVIVTSAPESVTTTDGEGDQIVLSRPTPGGVYTTRGARGDVVTVTYQPGGGTVSQVRVLTSTLPDGRQQTITSFAEVGGATQAAGEAPADPSSTEEPGLQSGAPTVSSWGAATFAAVMSAALGMIALL